MSSLRTWQPYFHVLVAALNLTLSPPERNILISNRNIPTHQIFISKSYTFSQCIYLSYSVDRTGHQTGVSAYFMHIDIVSKSHFRSPLGTWVFRKAILKAAYRTKAQITVRYAEIPSVRWRCLPRASIGRLSIHIFSLPERQRNSSYCTRSHNWFEWGFFCLINSPPDHGNLVQVVYRH